MAKRGSEGRDGEHAVPRRCRHDNIIGTPYGRLRAGAEPDHDAGCPHRAPPIDPHPPGTPPHRSGDGDLSSGGEWRRGNHLPDRRGPAPSRSRGPADPTPSTPRWSSRTRTGHGVGLHGDAHPRCGDPAVSGVAHGVADRTAIAGRLDSRAAGRRAHRDRRAAGLVRVVDRTAFGHSGADGVPHQFPFLHAALWHRLPAARGARLPQEVPQPGRLHDGADRGPAPGARGHGLSSSRGGRPGGGHRTLPTSAEVS